MKMRLSKKFVLIIGGVFVLCGASGAAAYFMARDTVLGPSYHEVNGLTCTVVQDFRFKRDNLSWVRQYVTSDEAGDGIARIKTALRVARAVQDKQKADIVQVAMLDKAGPKDRADMRGRVIGAQVVYIPDPAKAPAGADSMPYSAFYMEGSAGAGGEYYGQRIDMPQADVETMLSSLTDKTDCVDPKAEAAAAAAASAAAEHGGSHGSPKKKPRSHGARTESHGEAADAHDEGAESPEGAEGDASAHGETPVADAHGAAADAHGSEAAPSHGAPTEVAAKESGGFLSSLTSPISGLLFGSKPEAATAAHDAAGSDVAPAAGHAAEGQAGDVRPHDDQPPHNPAPHSPAAHDPAAHDPAAHDPTPHGSAHATEPVSAASPHDTANAAAAPVDAHAAAAKPPQPADKPADKPADEPAAAAPSPGLFDQVKGMIFGTEKPEAPTHQEAAAGASKPDVQAGPSGQSGHDGSAAASQAGPAPEPRTAAEGGKRWSKSDASDEIHAPANGDTAADGAHAAADGAHAAADGAHAAADGAHAAAPSPAAVTPASQGSNAADAAGAAWLAKFRAQSAAKP